MTQPMTHLEYFTQMAEQLDKLDGRTVVRGGHGGRDRDIEDLTDRVSEKLARKLRREGLL